MTQLRSFGAIRLIVNPLDQHCQLHNVLFSKRGESRIAAALLWP
jgi:hypothetical protein